MDRILNAESKGYSPRATAILETLGEVRLRELGRGRLGDEVAWATALIVRLGHHVDAAVLDRAPGLKAIVTATTGLDHIDLAAARERDIAVLSLKGETAFLDSIHATAEHTWAMLLALLRKLPQASEHAVDGGPWDRDRFRGRELEGKTLGVVGMGRIGRKVARYGLAFGMNVVGFDLRSEPWVSGVSHASTLREAAAASDILTIHVPLAPETEGMISGEVFGAMGSDAVLVNTSRGAIVDEDALIAALETGAIGGAALDVVTGETTGGSMREHPVVRFARGRDDVLVTPHIGGATFESMEKTEVFMANKLRTFLRGGDDPR